MEDLRPCPERLGEGVDADRSDHELLEVGGVASVLAAVEDVEERDRQSACSDAAEVAVERHAIGRGRRVGCGERHAQDGVGTELALVGRAVQGYERSIEAGLVGRIHAKDLGSDDVADVGDGLLHTLATEASLVTVAQLDRFVNTSRGAGGNAGAAEGPVVQRDVDLDGRVATRIEDLSGFDGLDAAHS
jgi:hypothetical protein